MPREPEGQRNWIQRCCANHLGVRLVERVDQGDEATNLIALLEPRHVTLSLYLASRPFKMHENQYENQ